MYHFHSDVSVYQKMIADTTREYVLPFIESVKPIRSRSNILEIGCGEGGNLIPFLERGCKCVGVDFDPLRIERANKLFHSEIEYGLIKFLTADVYHLEPDDFDSVFDIIIIKDVIEHIHDHQKFLRHLRKFLHRGGIIFFAFPPWQMPFGGHQQLAQSKILSRIPYIHLLPIRLYKVLLRSDVKRDELLEIRQTRLSAEQFEKHLQQTGYSLERSKYYFLNPVYRCKFKLPVISFPALMKKLPYLPNFFTTCMYAVVRDDTKYTKPVMKVIVGGKKALQSTPVYANG